jgi:hypothetical protein
MAEFHNAFRDSPNVPKNWKPKKQPGATLKVLVKNTVLRKFLQEKLPGRWVKVYHYGADGSEVHYCQHESGRVFDVEYHEK